MIRFFVDANVLVTVLNKEFPAFPDCARLLSLADKRGFVLVTSPMCLAIAFHFAQKKSGEEIAKQKIALLVSKLQIADNDKKDVEATLANKNIHDFEDGLEYYSALSSRCKCMVTYDTDDFYFSGMEVLRPEDFLLRYAV